MPQASPSDRYVDFSLRVLTVFVVLALGASAAFLGLHWLGPRLAPAGLAPPPAHALPPPPASSTAASGAADEVLMDPHRVFRCVGHGSVSFSDRACEDGPAPAAVTPPPVAAGR